MPQEKGGDKGKLPIPQVMLAATAAEILGTTALLPFESARIRAVSPRSRPRPARRRPPPDAPRAARGAAGRAAGC